MGSQAQGQYPGSLWMPHRQFWAGRGGHNARYIIIHGTATPGISTAQGIGRLFQSRAGKTSGPDDGGTHYIVGKDGTVVQGVKEQDSAWGNGVITAGHDDWWGTRGNPNLETISIEHVKVSAQNSDALTLAQMQAAFGLIEYLCNKWNIPKRWADSGGGITGHFSIDPINRRFCPGLYPWDELFQALTATSGSPGMPATATRSFVLNQDGMSPLPVLSATTGTSSTSSTTADSTSVASGPTSIISNAGTNAHQALQELPGFIGIAVALDQAEQFTSPASINGPGDIIAWIGENLFAALVRLLIMAAGLFLVASLLVSLARANDWFGDAGGDVIPLAFQGIHPTKPQGGAQ